MFLISFDGGYLDRIWVKTSLKPPLKTRHLGDPKVPKCINSTESGLHTIQWGKILSEVPFIFINYNLLYRSKLLH